MMIRRTLEARHLRHAAWGMTLALGLMPVPASAQEQGLLTQVTRTCDNGSSAVAARADETVEVVLSNGGSVTLAPGSSAEVGCTAAGRLTVTLETGILRVAAGPGAPPAVVRTAEGIVTLDDGAAVVAVVGGTTRVHLLTGSGLIVTSGGDERRLFRPGFEVVAADGALSRPRRMSASEVVADLRRINPGLESGIPPRGAAGALNNAAAGQIADTGADTGSDEVAPRFTALPQPEVGAEIDPPPVVTPPKPINFNDGLGTIDLAGGFGPSVGRDVSTVNETNTRTVFGAHPLRFQGQSEDDTLGYQSRTLGPTTTKLLAASNLTLGSMRDLPPVGVTRDGRAVGFAYETGTAHSDNLFNLKLASDPDNLPPGPDIAGRFLFNLDGVPNSGRFSTDTVRQVRSASSSFPSIRSDSAFGLDETGRPYQAGTRLFEGIGASAEGLTYGNPLCRDRTDCNDRPREKDNFIFLEARPAYAFTILCERSADCEGTVGSLAPTIVPTNSLLNERSISSSNRAEFTGLQKAASDSTRLLFATGDLDGLVGQSELGASVDTFYLSTGMAGEILGGVDTDLLLGMDRSSGALRAFARDATWTDLDERTKGLNLSGNDLNDSGLYVINPTRAVLGTGNTSKVLHADVAIAGNGTAQVSTISATIGEVEFRYSNFDGTDQPSNEADAFLSARTVGSSRGLTLEGRSAASTLIAGDVKSTAAGGGNPNADFSGSGRLGFLVLENAGDVFVNGKRKEVLPGGRELPMGVDPQAPDRTFALARLGVGVKSSEMPKQRGFAANTVGYAAGFVEEEDKTGVKLALLRKDASTPNLTFSDILPNRNEISASLTWDGGTIELGGAGGQSAYIDGEHFGLRSAKPGTSIKPGAPAKSGADVAMVSGNLVAKGLAGAGSVPRKGHYDHVKWGFFFGDVEATQNGGRQHVHLGTFAAGERLTAKQGLSVTNPVVTYRGHAAGNVKNGDRTYSAFGKFQDEFDFGHRKGNVILNIDGRKLSGSSVAPQDLQSYRGTVSGAGGFSGSLNGRFVGPLTNRRAGIAPAGIVGGFSVRDAGTRYRATGTFGAEQ